MSLIGLDSKLYDLNLLTDSRKLFLQQPIKLIKTTPSPTLNQAEKNPPHTLIIEGLITIKNETHPTKQHGHGLDRLSLTRARRPIGVAPHPQPQSQTQRYVAFVGEGRMNEFGEVPLILEGVDEGF
jgi:hypothetical protein